MIDPWKLENIRKSFEVGSPLAQGAALHKLQEMADEIAKLREENDRLREALNCLLDEETQPIHVGYDEKGNFVYAEAVRTDSDGFVAARAILKEPTP